MARMDHSLIGTGGDAVDELEELIHFEGNEAGGPTLVNGEEIDAIWERTQAGRVQAFLNPNDMGKQAYDVIFPPKALDEPYSLKIGSEIVWQVDGRNWPAVVRRLDIEPVEGHPFVIALCLLLTKK